MQTFIIVFIVILLAFLSVFAWFGGFKKGEFKIEKQGGETLVYEKISGDYKQSAKVMDSVYYSLLREFTIKTTKGFGIYYDNPQKVEKSKLRSEAGCILEKEDESKVHEISKAHKVKTFPEENYLVTEFPYKGKLSVIIGLMKVYPAMNKHLVQEHLSEDGAVMEIYDVPGKRIVYRKALTK